MDDHDVCVIARFEWDGSVTPLSIILRNGRRVPIDRVLDRRRAASTKRGGCGTRYRCRAGGREIFLFHDEERWFYE
jgi:hypothetical protein